MYRKSIVFALTLCAATNVAALDVAGVHVADTASVRGTELVLNGAGLRKRAIFKVYVGSLYLPAKATSAQAALAQSPRRIRLDVLRNLSADQLIDALAGGLRQNTTAAQFAALAVPTGELAAIMKSFGQAKEGSVVTLDFVDGATKIALNGAAKGSIAGDPFNRALTRIWLGDKPAQADLKKAMLGG